MIKAIARAFRWREMLENGTHATTAEIAAFAASTIDSNRFVEKTPKFETEKIRVSLAHRVRLSEIG